jgi:SPP1 gp7 family putative phage head morphogenesis protein
MGDLEQALLSGDPNTVAVVLNLEEEISAALAGANLGPEVETVKQAVEQIFRDGAAAAMAKLPKTVAAEVSFDLLNPRAIEFLRAYEFELIREISSGTQVGIRDVMERAFTEGMHPRKAAREIRGLIGLTERQSQAVRRFEEALASGNKAQLREALSRGLRDRRFDPTLRRALDEDIILSKDQIERMSQRYYERYLKHRAEVIARTEAIRASVEGQQELWRQGADQGVIPQNVLRRWVTAADERVCPICGPLHGEKTGLEESFDGFFAPPAHPMCRCAVVLEFPRRVG